MKHRAKRLTRVDDELRDDLDVVAHAWLLHRRDRLGHLLRAVLGGGCRFVGAFRLQTVQLLKLVFADDVVVVRVIGCT